MSAWLHLRQKENAYLRLIFFHEASAAFQESYLDWGDWRYYAAEAESLRLEIEERISRGSSRPMASLLPALQTLLRDFLKKTELVLPSEPVHLLWNSKDCFFPLELLYPGQAVTHFVPVKALNPSSGLGAFDPVLFLYGSGLSEAPGEIASLAKIIKGPFECFSDEHIEEYRSSMAGAKVFHFSGHGYWEEKGSIGLEHEKRCDIPYARDLSLAVLSCCNAGRAPAGIVESLLNQGAGAVIASPYALPGDLSGCGKGMEVFYSNLTGLGVDGAYAKAVGESEDFGFCFRLYKGFTNRFRMSRLSREA